MDNRQTYFHQQHVFQKFELTGKKAKPGKCLSPWDEKFKESRYKAKKEQQRNVIQFLFNKYKKQIKTKKGVSTNDYSSVLDYIKETMQIEQGVDKSVAVRTETRTTQQSSKHITPPTCSEGIPLQHEINVNSLEKEGEEREGVSSENENHQEEQRQDNHAEQNTTNTVRTPAPAAHANEAIPNFANLQERERES